MSVPFHFAPRKIAFQSKPIWADMAYINPFHHLTNTTTPRYAITLPRTSVAVIT
jgi:hypothetical protein